MYVLLEFHIHMFLVSYRLRETIFEKVKKSKHDCSIPWYVFGYACITALTHITAYFVHCLVFLSSSFIFIFIWQHHSRPWLTFNITQERNKSQLWQRTSKLNSVFSNIVTLEQRPMPKTPKNHAIIFKITKNCACVGFKSFKSNKSPIFPIFSQMFRPFPHFYCFVETFLYLFIYCFWFPKLFEKRKQNSSIRAFSYHMRKCWNWSISVINSEWDELMFSRSFVFLLFSVICHSCMFAKKGEEISPPSFPDARVYVLPKCWKANM